MIKKICAVIGFLDLLFLCWLLFSFSGIGDLGELYFKCGEQFLMIGVVK